MEYKCRDCIERIRCRNNCEVFQESEIEGHIYRTGGCIDCGDVTFYRYQTSFSSATNGVMVLLCSGCRTWYQVCTSYIGDEVYIIRIRRLTSKGYFSTDSTTNWTEGTLYELCEELQETYRVQENLRGDFILLTTHDRHRYETGYKGSCINRYI